MNKNRIIILILIFFLLSGKLFAEENRGQVLERLIENGNLSEASNKMRNEIILQIKVKRILFKMYGWFYFLRYQLEE